MTLPSSTFRYLPLPGQMGVILLSILMAFAADRAWDWRQDREEERVVLAGLHAEFEDYGETIEARIARWTSTVESAEAYFAEIRAGREPGPDAVRDVARNLVYSSTWDPGSGVRDALIAAGRLGVVRDVDLRHDLVGWDVVLGEVQDNEIVMRDFILDEFIPTLAAEGVPVGTLESNAPSGLSPDLESAAWSRIARDPEFLALAGVRYYGWLQSSIDEYRRAAAFVDELLALIESQSR